MTGSGPPVVGFFMNRCAALTFRKRIIQCLFVNRFQWEANQRRDARKCTHNCLGSISPRITQGPRALEDGLPLLRCTYNLVVRVTIYSRVFSCNTKLALKPLVGDRGS